MTARLDSRLRWLERRRHPEPMVLRLVGTNDDGSQRALLHIASDGRRVVKLSQPGASPRAHGAEFPRVHGRS
jgi:hypothetical protein